MTNADVLFIRAEFVFVILWLIFRVPLSHRVLVAWVAWAWCRWTWRHRKQSLHRWLWITTLRYANGKPLPR